MRRILVAVTLIAGTVLAALPAPALAGTTVPRSAGGAPGGAVTPVVLMPYWASHCRSGIYHLDVPQFVQLRLSESHGCSAHGPGTFITMYQWVRWNGRDGYGYGRWQAGTSRVRVWVHLPVWTHTHGTWRYFSRITIRTAPHFRTRVTHARWSWARRQWLLSR